jgi:4-methylaminobutanoate oxidase (formaldehyde-forming)
MKDQARLVIVGGGIVGVNIAYHLAKLGWTDVVLCEKGEVASGESSHAAGLVTQFATSQTLMQFRKYSIELYSGLGLFDHVGSLRVASSEDQLKELRRSVSRAKAIGMDVEIITPEEALRIMPQLNQENLYGAIYLPRDGQLDPYTTTTTMARLSREMGVEVNTGVRVTGIELSPRGEVQCVITDHGPIRTEIVVNAAGLWAPRVAAMAGLYIPTTPVDHQHIALKAVPGREFLPATPCLRDPDNLVYMRQEAGGLVIGGYEPNPLARWIDGVPWEHGGTTLPADYDRFEQLLEGAIRRIPFLDQAGIITLVCHPGAYTPDCQPMLGPTGLPALAIIMPTRNMLRNGPVRVSSITIVCVFPTTRTNGPAHTVSARSTIGCRKWVRSLGRNLAGNGLTISIPENPGKGRVRISAGGAGIVHLILSGSGRNTRLHANALPCLT